MSYIKFTENGTSPSGKTKRWVVEATAGGPKLGDVYWYAPWRKYVCETSASIFDEGCFREVADFTESETRAHRLGLQLAKIGDDGEEL
jgi:hypothetical protein